jgi:hypothetical protein
MSKDRSRMRRPKLKNSDPIYIEPSRIGLSWIETDGSSGWAWVIFFFFAISQKSQNNSQYNCASMQCCLHPAQPPPNDISFTQQCRCHLHPVMPPPSNNVVAPQRNAASMTQTNNPTPPPYNVAMQCRLNQ